VWRKYAYHFENISILIKVVRASCSLYRFIALSLYLALSLYRFIALSLYIVREQDARTTGWLCLRTTFIKIEIFLKWYGYFRRRVLVGFSQRAFFGSSR
jgi:hypothetical protein